MDNWKTQQIKDFEFIDVILGQSPSSSSYNDKKDGLPFLQGKAEFGMIYPTPEKHTSSPLKIAEENDILISVRAPVGDVNLAPYKLCIGRGLAALRIRKDSPRFYYYWFQKNKSLIENMGTGSTFKAITGEQIKKIELPIVAPLEQKAIAKILSTVDEAIQKADEAIKKTERVKQGVMRKLLTEGLNHTEFKETKIGRIPKEWEVKELSDVCNVGKNNYEPKPDGDLPFVGLEHIKPGDFYLTEYGVESEVKSTKTLFSSDNILYGKLRPYLDKAVITNTNGICSTDILVLSAQKRETINEFLLLNIHSKRFIDFAVSRTGGTNHPRTSWKEISKFPIAIPSIEEQEIFSKILTNMTKKLNLEIQRKQNLERIKRGLMDELLTGKKRVKINT